jgi:hypothetical protein
VSHPIRTLIRNIPFILCFIPIIAHAVPACLIRETGAAEVGASVIISPGIVSPFIVIGFVGGFVKHDAMAHSAVQLATHLRQDYPSGVYTEALENHHGGKAYLEIIRLLDTNRDGELSTEEKKNARIILYGHSWGASEVVTLARELGRQGIPVLLTIQVDSVAKPGENDKIIPPNVAEAVNFYQLNGFLHGQTRIRAADPARTRIIGNFLLDYKANPIRCKEYPWYDRLFMKAHIQIECDPRVWTQVESLIDSRLPPRR